MNVSHLGEYEEAGGRPEDQPRPGVEHPLIFEKRLFTIYQNLYLKIFYENIYTIKTKNQYIYIYIYAVKNNK